MAVHFLRLVNISMWKIYILDLSAKLFVFVSSFASTN